MGPPPGALPKVLHVSRVKPTRLTHCDLQRANENQGAVHVAVDHSCGVDADCLQCGQLL